MIVIKPIPPLPLPTFLFFTYCCVLTSPIIFVHFHLFFYSFIFLGWSPPWNCSVTKSVDRLHGCLVWEGHQTKTWLVHYYQAAARSSLSASIGTDYTCGCWIIDQYLQPSFDNIFSGTCDCCFLTLSLFLSLSLLLWWNSFF